MPRFVILYHEMPATSERSSHWDLMVEQNDALLKPALNAKPELGRRISARKMPDHRLDYLTLEGPVSHHRGHVQRIEQGCCEIIATEHNRFVARISGRDLSCEVRIEEDLHSKELIASFEPANSES